jgi:hypothetical protein
MKKFILIISLSISLLVNAQVDCYIVGGTSHAINVYHSTQPGFNLGAIVNLPFSKAWGFQTGLNYNFVSTDSNRPTSKLVVNKMVDFDGGVLYNYSFIELPASITAGIKLSERSKLKFNLGGYFSIFTGGKSLYRSSDGYSKYVLLPTWTDPVGGGFLVGTGFEINKIYLGVELNYSPESYNPNTVIKTKLGIRL